MPDLITGDFDSAEISHVENFKGLGSTVAKTPDQDQTDFTKALIELEKSHVDGLEAVVAFIEAGGRVDHLMGNFQVNDSTCVGGNELEVFAQTLALVPNLAPSLPPVFLCSSHSISWLLRPGALSPSWSFNSCIMVVFNLLIFLKASTPLCCLLLHLKTVD